MFLGSVSEFPGEVLRIKLPSLPSGIGLLLEAGLPLADRCLWLEETLPQSPFLGNFSQMIIHLNGSIFTPVCLDTDTYEIVSLSGPFNT